MLKDKRVLVTGACGTIGSKLIVLFLGEEYRSAYVIGHNDNERGLFFLEQRYLYDKRVRFFLADTRDRDKLRRKMRTTIGIAMHKIRNGVCAANDDFLAYISIPHCTLAT